MVKLINGDSSMGAAYLAAKLYDSNLEFVKNFDNKKYASQLDQFYVKQLIQKHTLMTNRQQQIKFDLLNKDELVYKEV
jgi:hypothetical protein